MSTGQKSKTSRIRVIARTRPTANFAKDVIHLEDDGKTVSVHLPKNDDQLQGFINNQQQNWRFPLDKFLHNASQEVVHSECASEIVTKALEGYNGSILAYGQTGAGKTFTMTGGHPQSYRQRGITPRAISQVFSEIKERYESSISVRVSYLEIYNEVISDLLSTLSETKTVSKLATSPGLQVTEDESGHVTVKGLTLRPVTNEEEAINYLFEGETNRSISAHALNKNSSRSHCVFTIYIENRSLTRSTSAYTLSKLNLVDLAGSERLSKTESIGSTQKEAMYINKSLTFLEQVIVALADKRRDHVPYRQSKLTHVLRDSLGGSCNTLMIANIWTEPKQIEETVSTLKFATRMMCVPNEPVKSTQHDPYLLIREHEEEIKALKLELAMHDTLLNRGTMSYEALGEPQLAEIGTQIRHYVDGSIASIEFVSIRQMQEVLAQFKTLVKDLEQSLATSKQTDRPPSVQHHAPEPAVTAPSKRKLTSPLIKGKLSKQQTQKALASTQATAPPDTEEELVGEGEGAGFGLGLAPSSLKHPSSPMMTARKAKVANKGDFKLNPSEVEFTEEGLQTDAAPSEPSTRPSTPPPREEAFEQFKQERGREINLILLQNKETMHKKKLEAKELSEAINSNKKQIDQMCEYLDGRESERIAQGDLRTDTGGVVIDEEEYQAITQLKQLKSDYREKYEQLQVLNAELRYCEQYVEQSREKLLAEFDTWYRQCFLGDDGVTDEGPSEYPNERFDRLQAALLKEDPATTAFYNAQLRTSRRVFEGTHKKPGQVTASIRNKPPGIMSFS